ncbi:MAG TPA: FUSC family protein, partial [Candidatus Binataceae bacterium]|nr:FUSC family protein [Candidatus Binataceae bacterium]
VYLLWSIVSAPAAMMVPATGALLIAVTGIALAVSVPLAGVLVEAPWMLVAFFAIAAAASTYLLSDAQLTNGWRMVQIFSLSSFWVVVFDPQGFGWSVAYAFSAALVGFSFIMLFDNVLWPDPAERRLLRLLAASAETIRKRLAAMGSVYLEPAGAVALPRLSQRGAMSAQLALLSRATRENLSPLRHARLLAAVSVSERMRLEVERLLSIAREPLPHRIREMLKPQLQAVLDAIDAALVIDEGLLAGGLDQAEDTMPDAAGPIYSMLEAYNRRVAELHPQFILNARPDELSNLSAFVLGLQRIARLFIHTPIPLAAGARKAARPRARPGPGPAGSRIDPARVRYCLKLAAAVALAFVVGVTTHRADLTTILWTVMITGLPTYGASMRKMILRFVGAALGGVLGLAAIIAVSPNFETVVTYMAVFFIALVPCAYVGLGGERLAYPGKQAGVTFCLLFVGLSPSVREYEALWRLWGVLLGVIVVAVVFIVLWPEYAGESMVPRLEKMLELILSLMPGGGRAPSEGQIELLEMECSQTLSELLAIADDARIEGGLSGFDPDAMVDAVGTLRRIAHRLGSVAAGGSSQEMPTLAPRLQSARDAIDSALRAHFEACLDYVKRRAAGGGAPSVWNEDAARTLLDNLHQQVAADDFSAVSSWPLAPRRTLLAQIESYRRLAILAGELSDQLSRIALPRPARQRQLQARTAAA